MSASVIQGDVLEWAATYDGPPHHALLCDPPYHLTTVDRFGPSGSAPAKGDVYARASRGFMGQQWDGGDVAFRPETWAALAKHLLPGMARELLAEVDALHRVGMPAPAATRGEKPPPGPSGIEWA